MTVRQLVKQLDQQQIDIWWQQVTPEQVPEKDKQSNWKYFLKKDSKTVEFKWAIRDLANYYNLDLESFSSSLGVRNTFCEAFDFSIKEALVYDNTEFETFKKAYSKINNKILFQQFVMYANTIITKNNFDAYTIRMAIKPKGEFLVVIGMRAVLSYHEKNGESFVGFIIDFDLFEEYKSEASLKLDIHFSGDDNKCFIYYKVDALENVQEDLLKNNTLNIVNQYQKISDTKRAQWNIEANTTNSVLKSVMFNNDYVESWIKENDIKYWALGFGSGEYYERLKRFKKENYWQGIDYNENDTSRGATTTFSNFRKINVGDYVIIKGYGGNHDLNIHYKGKVISKDSKIKRINLEKIDDQLLKMKAPSGKGSGNWRDTILEIKLQRDIDLIFKNNLISKTLNVKDEFISWLVQNPRSNYFDNNIEMLNRYLDTYNSYFNIDIFQVSKENYVSIIENINEEAYINEDSDFFTYSLKESTHRPRAILGKDNYFKFLNKKFKPSRMKLFLDFKDYLNQYDFASSTVEAYVNSVEKRIPEEWKKLYHQDFNNFKYNLENLESLKTITKKSYPNDFFKGKHNFSEFLSQLILKIEMNEINYTTTNQILYGPPGTGKTYGTKEKAVSIIDPNFINTINVNLNKTEKRKQITDKYEALYNSGQIVFTTFHQSMSYEDFVEGIKPKTVNNNVVYDIYDGIFKLISDVAKDNWEAYTNRSEKELAFDDAFKQLKDDWEEDSDIKFPLKTKGYDFTIIGFTNKSIQFKKASGGTGHTLSINTLRKGFYNTNTIKSTGVGIYYPPILERLKTYSSSKVETIALNQYVLIIDEINRGNVSAIFGELITLLEADKRIGGTEEIRIKLPYTKNGDEVDNEDFGVPSNLHIIGTMNTADRSVEALDTALRRRFEFKEMMPKPNLLEQSIQDISLKKVLKTINNRIEVLLDRDHTIGHSYFIKLEQDDVNGLRQVFKNSIIPLLQEYFYNDYEKMGLVLGAGFFKEPKKVDRTIFAKFETQIYPDQVNIHQLKTIDKTFNIIKAVKILLKETE